MQWLRYRFEYGCVVVLAGLVRLLPVACSYGMARLLAWAFFHVGLRRRRITLANLRAAFPEWGRAECRRVAKASYRNVALAVMEGMLVLTGRRGEEDLLSMVEVDEWDKLDRIDRENGRRGLLFVTAHFGNWEMLSHYVAIRAECPCNVVGRKTTNPLLEEKVVQPLRERFGSRLIHKKRAMIRCIKALNRGEYVGLLIDQKSNKKDGVEVEFFGQSIYATATPAVLQMRYDVPVISAFVVRCAPKKYRFVVGGPIPWEDTGAPQEEQVRALTQRHQQEIETMIRQYPEQWFWMHDRWRRES